MKTSRTVVGVDTAKRVFQLHWVDMETGEIVDLKLTRAKFLEHFANRVPCLVAMEACGGTQHWARRIRELGHEVRLLPAKMVRPFVKCHSYQDTSLRYSKSKVFCAVPDAGGGAPFSSARATTGKPSALASITHGAPLQA